MNYVTVILAFMTLAIGWLAIHEAQGQTSYNHSWSSSRSWSSGGGPEKSSWQHSDGDSRQSHYRFRNTPIIDVLSQLARSSGQAIMVEQRVVDSHLESGKKVSGSYRDQEVAEIVMQILPDGVEVAEEGDRLVIRLKGSPVDPQQDEVLDVRELAVLQALEKVAPVHFDRAPADMVVQMIAGMANLSIDSTSNMGGMDLGAGDRGPSGFHSGFGQTPQWVTIHRDQATLGTCLKEVLAQIDKDFTVTEGVIRIVDRD